MSDGQENGKKQERMMQQTNGEDESLEERYKSWQSQATGGLWVITCYLVSILRGLIGR